MRLDKTVEAHPGKGAFFLFVGLIAGILLPLWLPILSNWRTATLALVMLASAWAARPRRIGRWTWLFDVAAVVGAAYFDYVERQASPAVTHWVFLVAWLGVMLPMGFWLHHRGAKH